MTHRITAGGKFEKSEFARLLKMHDVAIHTDLDGPKVSKNHHSVKMDCKLTKSVYKLNF